MMTPCHATVMCSVAEGEGCYVPELNSKPNFDRCPRSILQGVLANAHETHSFSFIAGFELEFYLLQEDESHSGDIARFPPTHPRFNCQNSAVGLRGRYAACVEACVDALADAGIEIEQFLAEAGVQQFEISTGPLPVLAAVDALSQSIEIVKVTAAKHNMRACFMPKPLKDYPPTGLHAHLSITKEPHEAGCGVEDFFLAGIMHRLPLLAALAMPYEENYLRIEPLALGDWVSWGSNNRSTPVRKVSNGRFELRALNATANMYLVIAAYIGAGVLGIRERQELRWKDCRRFLSHLDEEHRLALGIDTPMPTCLGESVKILQAPWMGLEQVLGTKMIDLFKAVKKGERTTLGGMTDDDRDRLLAIFF